MEIATSLTSKHWLNRYVMLLWTRTYENNVGNILVLWSKFYQLHFVLLDFSLTVKAAPHECVISTSQT